MQRSTGFDFDRFALRTPETTKQEILRMWSEFESANRDFLKYDNLTLYPWAETFITNWKSFYGSVEKFKTDTVSSWLSRLSDEPYFTMKKFVERLEDLKKSFLDLAASKKESVTLTDPVRKKDEPDKVDIKIGIAALLAVLIGLKLLK